MYLSVLTLLVGWQDGHLACKKTEWGGAGMVICLEQGADFVWLGNRKGVQPVKTVPPKVLFGINAGRILGVGGACYTWFTSRMASICIVLSCDLTSC